MTNHSETLRQGIQHHRAGKLREAESAYRRVLQQDPNHPDALHLSGVIAHQMGKNTVAADFIRKAIANNPEQPEFHTNLGIALEMLGKTEDAIRAYTEALHLRRDDVRTLCNMGKALIILGDFEAATEKLRKALALDPKCADAYNYWGLSLQHQGEINAAIEKFREALRLRPDYAEALYNLALSGKYDSADHKDISDIQTLLKRPGISRENVIRLGFALGKIYDDCGLYKEAFAHYQNANRLRHKSSRFNTRALADFIDRLIHTFDSEFFAQQTRYGSDSELPVFIVGMLRSGTTLVEQIISSHSHAHGAGELKKIGDMVNALSARFKGKVLYPEYVRHISARAMNTLARSYEDCLRRGTGTDILRISDKMPQNYFHLGLISLLFPKARIIHCRRHPMDICLSNYFQYYGPGSDPAYDLAGIGAYYRQYKRLMAHWRKVLPLKMYEIQYEELIANTEDNVRRLIRFLGLEWEERCLSFHRNPRAVQTASVWQVRQPLYTRSVHRWQNYEDFLGPLKKSLGFED
ncbi:tetratricopeptide repeat-containing sulfotransferase family protein [Desulfonema magnum]|uniref:Tetratricopeptide repeat-containing protein n=1 Tax=Desulfonema magnum TaxID=45655 RepID=A0A975BRS9_9BACT|nr:sulfotransferase [Desulfonema magnum]QTA90213.1 Tetratricopeptide repeat-containing protein [Desulfonema magnum]